MCDFEERAAIIEHDGGLPRVWAESLARLCVAPKPLGWPDHAWDTLIDDAARFIEGWMPRIRANQWEPRDLRNLFVEIKGRPVVAVKIGEVHVSTGRNGVEKLRRRPLGGSKAPAWEGT